MIKQFPEFTPVDLTCRAEIKDCFRVNPVSASEYNFSNLFAWAPTCGYHVASFNNGLLFLRDTGDDITTLQPVGVTEPVIAIEEILKYLQGRSADPRIERVGEDFLQANDLSAFDITEDRDQFDYIYLADDLINLPGQKYHDKKNLISQFDKKYKCEYKAMNAEIARLTIDFAEFWCEKRECDEDEGLSAEKIAVMRMLENFDELQITGGVLIENTDIIAFALGEQHTTDTFVIHVEKGIPGYTGIYQAMNQKFAAANAKSLYINREQDIGVPGLRRAKESYNPIKMGKKYIIRNK
jgi:hypothetical protein